MCKTLDEIFVYIRYTYITSQTEQSPGLFPEDLADARFSLARYDSNLRRRSKLSLAQRIDLLLHVRVVVVILITALLHA